MDELIRRVRQRVRLSVPRSTGLQRAALGGAAVASVTVLATVAASLSASSSSGGATAGASQTYCGTFSSHLAADLGKSQDQVKKAVSDSFSQTLNDAVKRGDITQVQANQVKSAVSGSTVCDAGFPGFFDRDNLLGVYAQALGMNESDVLKALNNGQTVHDLANAKGMDKQEFRAALAKTVKANYADDAATGTAPKAQVVLEQRWLENGPVLLWDKSLAPAGASPSPSSVTGAGGVPAQPTATATAPAAPTVSASTPPVPSANPSTRATVPGVTVSASPGR